MPFAGDLDSSPSAIDATLHLDSRSAIDAALHCCDTSFPANLFRSKTSGQVLFLEAGKDFVDTLLSFLLLPLGTVVHMTSTETVSLRHPCQTGSQQPIRLEQSFHFDRVAPPLPGRRCGEEAQRLHDLVAEQQPVEECNRATGPGFVKENIAFMVTDKLEIMPSTTIENMSVLEEMKVNSLADLECKKITVTITQVLRLLGSALTSNSCLNDVFGTGETSRIPGTTSASEMIDATAKVRELLIPCDEHW